MSQIHFTLPNLEATEQLASVIAEHSKTGDIITLKGELGTGKTAFTKAFINHLLTEKETVSSPTFNIVQLYHTPSGEVWHFDLFRLKDQKELFELGIEDAFTYGISIIEWPDIMMSLFPEDFILLELSYGDSQGARQASLSAYGNKMALLDTIQHEPTLHDYILPS